MDAHPPVADGVLVDLSLWETSIIGLAVQCPDGKYFGSLRAPGPVYDQVLEFLKRNHGRKLREVMDAEDGHLRRDSIAPWPNTSNAPVPSVTAIGNRGPHPGYQWTVPEMWLSACVGVGSWEDIIPRQRHCSP